MYAKVKAEKFNEIKNQLPKHLAAYLSPYNAKDYEEMGAACYLSHDEKSGYAIKADGELISVFSLPGANQGREAVKSAAKNGACKLDCLGDFLARLYSNVGFVEVERHPWNDDYAPENWDYAKFKTPDLIFMEKE